MAQRRDQQHANFVGPFPVVDLDAKHRRHRPIAGKRRLGHTGGPAGVDDAADRLRIDGAQRDPAARFLRYQPGEIMLSAAAEGKDKRTAPRQLDRPGHVGMASLIDDRSEEHTSELQSLMRISYAVFCLKKKKKTT